MIVNLRRKVGLATGQQTPIHRDHDLTAPPANSIHLDPSHFNDPSMAGDALSTVPTQASLPPIRIQDLDLSWPNHMMFSPTTIPMWLQETVRRML